ncbi:MAG: transcriptional regulator, partial [Actinobacteria bacterium]|nr:transcriptional regulator [Actinomycetota bacterium]
AAAALAELGFEPERTDGGVLLRNCPFHELVRTHRPLVCSMNHALVRSLVKGLGEGAAGAVRAEPRELPGYCCVALVAAR